ncbi:MAG: hypothetical protein KatS3mg070_0529 [Meiothermus sp.]|uniref:hypothetical protein n=1 Tax=Meiothermus sp. TaxID=1955249 RepID=UPI0021DEAFED|nr:hypothetical protein [Meiothermus sp.]GIW27166.1 MAG: hypothetical protein KatS3mg070_0529 [Meiothermus sp.]
MSKKHEWIEDGIDFTRLTKVPEGVGREMVTSDGYESLELYADMFMLDDEEVQTLKAIIKARRKGEQ